MSLSSPVRAAVERWRYRTTDADEGTEALRAHFTEHVTRFSGSPEGFELRLDGDAVETDTCRLVVEHVRHSMTTLVAAEPTPRLLLVVPLAGWARVTCGHEEAASTMLVPHRTAFEMDWGDLESVAVQVDLDGVRRIAGEISGLDPAAIDFTALRPISDAHARYLRSTVAHVREQLADDEAMSHPLVRASAVRQLVAALVAAFPNTTHTLPPPGGRDGGEPATIRRAMEYMDAHAHEEVDLAQVAAASRIGARGLQAAFRRHRDQSPLDYLRRVRMERAHRDLEVADQTRGDTVGAIAARWGFANAGRFAVEYRRVHGRSPGETLRS